VSVRQAFRAELRVTIEALTEKGLLAHQPVGMPAAAGFEAGLQIDLVNPTAPALLDRYLGSFVEKLFNNQHYPYLMGDIEEW
jgi:hypothetical protein